MTGYTKKFFGITTNEDLIGIEEFFEYHPGIGDITLKCKRRKNDVIGSSVINKGTEYNRVSWKGVKYQSTKVIWYLVYGRVPNLEIDHINQNKKDDRITNLRELKNYNHNAWNTSIRKNNTTGVKGVSVYQTKCGYSHIAQVRANGRMTKKSIHNKVYSEQIVNELGIWIRAKRVELHGEYHCHG